MSFGYGYAVDDACCEVFHTLARRHRERLLVLFRLLATHPLTPGDYRDSDARGQSVEVLLFEHEFLISWHADHAAKQIRIVGLEII